MKYKEYVGTVWTRAGSSKGRKVWSVIMKYIDDDHILRHVYSVDVDPKIVTFIPDDDIMGKEMETMISNGAYHQANNAEMQQLVISLFERKIIMGRG